MRVNVCTVGEFHGEAHRADRLVVRAASGPRDSGDRDRGVGPEAAQRAVGHRLGDGLGHRPVRGEQVRLDAEQLGLRLVE